MSVNSYGYAVIGCMWHSGELTRTVQLPCCQHTLPDGAQFCPQCGKPRFVEAKECRLNSEGRDELHRLGISVASTTDNVEFVVCLPEARTRTNDINETGGVNRAKLTDFAGIKERTKQLLEPQGLWRESTFGLWAVGRCSY